MTDEAAGPPRREPRPADAHPVAKPHWASRFEDVLFRLVSPWLVSRGWVPRVLGYTGYGSSGWVRVLGRVVLAPRGRRGQAPDERPDPERGWRAFLSVPVPAHRVRIEINEQSYDVVTDRGGYIDLRLDAQLPPGWHPVTLRTAGDVAANCDVRIVAPDATLGVVCDIDDTVMVTHLPRPFLAAWNSFVLKEHARRPVTGMARLLQSVVDADPEAAVVYLSTGAWNVAPTIERFLARHEFPPGPLLLTDWGPTNTGWFRSGIEHKCSALRRLADELPAVRWVLVGDDGQHDPKIYADFASECPQAVRGVAIRQLTPVEQVLSSGTPGPARDSDGHTAPPAVPWVTGPDGRSLGSQLRQEGVLD
jgi:phosphatidate phosphatase APP1